jgi:phosphoserine phosphatase
MKAISKFEPSRLRSGQHDANRGMTHVATLIAGCAGGLNDLLLGRARARLPGAADPRWLADGIAADIPFSPESAIDHRALTERLRAVLDAPVDVVVQPGANRRKRLFLADMDSTMIGQECIDELAAYVGLKAHVAAITERAMRGEIAFEPALRERVALLKNLPVGVVEEVIDKHITLTPGARTLVATLRAHGTHTCLVSGGFTLFTTRIAAMIGFDETHANRLALDGERLAGRVEEPVFGRAAKLATLEALRARLELAPEDTLATGDGANDLDMLLAAGLGVAYHAKPKVAEAAAARIDHADLTALLFVQGYRREEFVEN